MTHEDYVSFEQAKLLKELEFDWECNHVYYGENATHVFPSERKTLCECFIQNSNDKDYRFSAPTLSQAQKWLREVKGIDVIAIPTFGEYGKKKYRWQITIYKEDFGEESETISTYEEALSVGIDKALEILKSL